MNTEIENAVIDYTKLGTEDHGIFTCMIGLDYGHSGQGFGGYGLDAYDQDAKRRIGHAFGIDFIKAVLNVAGVTNWEDLNGTPVRSFRSDGLLKGLGHYLKDQWMWVKRGDPHGTVMVTTLMEMQEWLNVSVK
jgi:hypothetical protein